jgi:hydroxylamine dehydrogenase
MAKVTPAEALKKTGLGARISVAKAPAEVAGFVVGCAECHTMNPERHRDTFDHEGYQVPTVVTPQDCATCHPVEVRQYGRNLMSRAYGNLNENPVYHNLVETTAGSQIVTGSWVYRVFVLGE